jgi:predicted regulator of Ras-like GTPase activity (Roadblock/LC7/MglB family)
MESEKDREAEEEKLDFDKIISRYRMATARQETGRAEEKAPVAVERAAPVEKQVVPKVVQPPPAIKKPPLKEIVTSEDAEKYFEWVKVVESAIQNCLSQSKGAINSIYVLLPDGITCLSFGSRIDLDEDILAAFIGEQFELFESYSGILQIGEIEEIEYTGKQSVVLMKSGSGLRLMALLNDKSYVRLAKIYLERTLKSIPRFE